MTALGVQLLVTGDDNHNARVTVRYRRSGATSWREGLPLHRVRPEVITGRTVPAQFAGSLFDLEPAVAYEIEIHATDPDGPVDETRMLTATTRAVPRRDPATPAMRPVSDAAGLRAALAAARKGDVILLADGTYAGTFSINASGDAQDPIVIRGQSQDGTVLDGGGCTACNILEVYGSFVHIERLTLQNASRALRFQTAAAEGNVVRRVRIRDVTLGFGSRQDQKGFYICDNVVEGRLAWPAVYTDDGGAHSNDDGILVEGHGHVVCHNRVIGFGDSLKSGQDGARAIDFYGNEVLSAYDNGIELDGSEGNVRALRNRFTNTFATLSFQPVFGGPAYAIRNVVVNVAHEQMKFHGLGTTPAQEPSGMIVLHNTFVSPGLALNLATSATSHYFTVQNNLFVGPAAPTGGRVVDWTGPIHEGLFDYNGWSPDGAFRFNLAGMGLRSFSNLAALQASGWETHGVAMASPPFVGGLQAPADYRTALMPSDVTPAAGAAAIDRGVSLPNVGDVAVGAAPDLGAQERGCPIPIYGPRPEGVDESTPPPSCSGAGPDAGASDGPGGPADGGGGDGPAADAPADGAGEVRDAPAEGAAEVRDDSLDGGSGGPDHPAGADARAADGASPGGDGGGGCGCRAASSAPAPETLALMLLAVAIFRRRTHLNHTVV